MDAAQQKQMSQNSLNMWHVISLKQGTFVYVSCPMEFKIILGTCVCGQQQAACTERLIRAV